MKYKCKCGNVIRLMMWSAWDWATITSENIKNSDKLERQDSEYAKCDKCKTITHITLNATYKVIGVVYENDEKEEAE